MMRMLQFPATLTGAEFRELLRARAHPDDRDELDRVPTEAFGHRQRRFATESRMIVAGTTLNVIHRGEVSFDDDGRVLSVRGTAQDVTERRQTQAELASAKGRLAQERRTVGLLHDTFIRPSFPAVDGYEIGALYKPADEDTEIGGDWYDAFALRDGRIMLAVGDVSGHGVEAARLMAKLRHATRAYAWVDEEMEVVLSHLDGFLEQFGDTVQIATLLLARLDPATARWRWVRPATSPRCWSAPTDRCCSTPGRGPRWARASPPGPSTRCAPASDPGARSCSSPTASSSGATRRSTPASNGSAARASGRPRRPTRCAGWPST